MFHLTNIILEVQEGNEEAFKLLHKKYNNRIAKFFHDKRIESHYVDDLLQMLWTKVWGAIKRLKKPRSFDRWLYQIASNLVVDYIRKKKRMLVVSIYDSKIQSVYTNPEDNKHRDIVEQLEAKNNWDCGDRMDHEVILNSIRKMAKKDNFIKSCALSNGLYAID